MSVTEFAMVEELAFLVKDNLRCKHLVLSMEEAFLNFLQEDTHHSSESDGILELEPMDAYNRLLLHRLADIFGFSHVSVGEGDNRHLIIERCPETSIPSILVSDILFQYDEPHTPTTSHQLLRRKDAPPVLLATSPPSRNAFREREVAYLAARDRIFSRDVGEMREPVKEKPQNVLVVARRMIAHALGQNTSLQNQDAAVGDGAGRAVKTKEHVQEKGKTVPNSSSEAFQGIVFLPDKNINSFGKAKSNDHGSCASSQGPRNSHQGLVERGGTCNINKSQNRTSRIGTKDYSKEEHMGAAKRMFAHALGRQLGDQTRNNDRKRVDE